MLDSGLPSTFVPGRNLVFFTYAAALGYRRGLTHAHRRHVRDGFLRLSRLPRRHAARAGEAIRLGTEIPFAIETPLMWRTKAETWALAEELGGASLVDLIIGETHTCYRGERGARHDWGYGCGACPACELRARGFAAWQSAKSAAQAASC